MTPNGIIRFYLVEITSDDDSEEEIFTSDPSVIITMLEIFTTYQIQVFASTSVSEGNGSDVIMATTDEDSELFCLHTYTTDVRIIISINPLCL